MERLRGDLPVVQNIGLADRLIRFFGGGALLIWGALSMVIYDAVTLASVGAILLAIYPLMTTVMGWDPIYQIFGTRSCSLEGGRNQCGTLPYEVDSALGHDPKPDRDYEYDHSLTGSHHEPKHGAHV
ncbi:MAG: DUF2892 domain-containing protein [Gammaproteobacteria bacterium]